MTKLFVDIKWETESKDTNVTPSYTKVLSRTLSMFSFLSHPPQPPTILSPIMVEAHREMRPTLPWIFQLSESKSFTFGGLN